MKGAARRTALGGNNPHFLGGNSTLWTHTDENGDHTGAFMIDCGFTFSSKAKNGYDLVLPDATGVLNKKGEPRADDAPEALFVTHAHYDHIGAIAHYVKMGYELPKIHTTEFTRLLIEDEFKKLDIDPADWPDFKDIKPGDTVKIGDFEVEAFSVTHSIPDSLGFAVRAEDRLFVESGDLRTDQSVMIGPPTDIEKLFELGNEGVDTFFCDATKGGLEDGVPTAKEMQDEFKSFIDRYPDQRVIVSLYGGYVEMMAYMAAAAVESGRKVVIGDGSPQRYVNAMRKAGIDFEKMVEQKTGKKLELIDGCAPGAMDAAGDNPLVLLGGTMGNAESSLGKAARDEDSWLTLDALDVVTVCGFIMPGLENSFSTMCDAIKDKGIELRTNADPDTPRQHGHGTWREISDLIDIVRPARAIPKYGYEKMMTTMRDKIVDEKSVESDILLNGDTLEFDAKGHHVTRNPDRHNRWIGVSFDRKGGEISYDRITLSKASAVDRKKVVSSPYAPKHPMEPVGGKLAKPSPKPPRP